MASVISDVGGGDIVGGDGGSDGVGSFHEVDNWLGSSSYATQEGWQQPGAPLVKSSPAPGCSMGCSLAGKKWYIIFHFNGRKPVTRCIYEADITFLTLQSLIASEGGRESDYMYYVNEENIGSGRVKYLGNEDSVHEMLEVYHHVKSVNIRVQKKINDRKAQLERSRIQREADLNHFEGDTEVSEFCSDNSVHSNGSANEAIQMEIDSASEEDRPLELTALVKYVKNLGPTSRFHNDVEHKEKPDWFPKPDEFCFAGDLGISDEEEEDEVDLPYLLKKPKSNKKKMKDRVWFDPSIPNSHLLVQELVF
ncbi:hypothetical protein D1007_36547 [Hordeum vulgare]|nr:hypothetical protein D1007_36547 [Hordeum vulgare]